MIVPGGLLREVRPLTKGMKYRIPSLPRKGAADYSSSWLLSDQLLSTPSKSRILG